MCMLDFISGREDFDVRMLGAGRPFVLEIINPRAASPDAETMKAMQTKLDEVSHSRTEMLQVMLLSIRAFLESVAPMVWI